MNDLRCACAPQRDDPPFVRDPAGLADACATAAPARPCCKHCNRPLDVLGHCPNATPQTIEDQQADRSYPTDPLGSIDVLVDTQARAQQPPPPCCKRMNTIPISWCGKPDGHEPPCHADPVRPIELDDLGPASSKRRRY